MRETTFLKQNEQKWKEFESILKNSQKKVEPDTLADLFIELTDDLSYAKTHYPQSKTVSYLNGLAATVHQAIYKNKREKTTRYLTFWSIEVPAMMSKILPNVLLSFVIFALAGLIGFYSANRDPNFLRLILGDRYVNMTINNIENGRPMDVYDQGGEAESFLMITLNNVRVSFVAFIAGILLSIGTVFILFQNGLMVGAFIGFLAQKKVLLISMQSIMVHGTLELSAIVIAAAAGLEMGNALLFPGTLSRLQSLRNGARRGLKVIVGLIPVFIIAGFVEGFITRDGQDNPILAWTIISLSAIFILGYFIVYPLILNLSNLDAKS